MFPLPILRNGVFSVDLQGEEAFKREFSIKQKCHENSCASRFFSTMKKKGLIKKRSKTYDFDQQKSNSDFLTKGDHMLAQSIIQSSGQQVFSFLNYAMGRYSLNLPDVAGRLNKIAIPAIALFAFSSLGGAMAGPISYSSCVMGCSLFFTPAAFPGCITACLPILFLPSP